MGRLYSWLLMLLFLVFVFQGDPDLWDVWHAKAMGVCQVK